MLSNSLLQNRLAILDLSSGIKFLIDTGTDISVLPRSILIKYVRPASLKIYAANGSTINTYSERLTLNLKLRRPLTWRFIIADVPRLL